MNKTEIYKVVGECLDEYETAKLKTAANKVEKYKEQRGRCVHTLQRKYHMKVREIAELLDLPIPHVRNIIIEFRKKQGFLR